MRIEELSLDYPFLPSETKVSRQSNHGPPDIPLLSQESDMVRQYMHDTTFVGRPWMASNQKGISLFMTDKSLICCRQLILGRYCSLTNKGISKQKL
jgi:hypothetical protein